MTTKIATAVASLLCVGLLAGCGHDDQGGEAADSATGSTGPETVTVATGVIAPTVSVKSGIIQQPSLVITLEERGSFKSAVKPGDRVSAGTVVGEVNGTEIAMPVDGVIASVAPSADDLPKNYAVIEFHYQGFGLTASAPALLKASGVQQLKGKFQVPDGVGPTDCLAVVRAANAGNGGTAEGSLSDPEGGAEPALPGPDSPEPGGHDQESPAGPSAASPAASLGDLICLISKDVDVSTGQEANVVITATQRDGVLVLPISAVAGRIDKGRVTKVVDGKFEEVEVTLGATDGAQIEIVDGLADGDTVAVDPPEVDPRRP